MNQRSPATVGAGPFAISRPSSPLRLDLGGIAEDRGFGDLADRLVAQVLVEELADPPTDFRAAEAAVTGVDDLDEGARDAPARVCSGFDQRQ
jgi:hypothetical protein